MTPDLLHLQPEVVALTGALAHAGEHRHATVLGGHPVDHLLDDDGLAHAGPAEQADLAALHVGREQVDDLDARSRTSPTGARGRRTAGDGRWMSQRSAMPSVTGSPLGVEGLADDVEHVAEHALADRHGDALAGVVRPALPRRRPSVGFMQMARTRLSPMCWATSAVITRSLPSSSTVIVTRVVDLGQGVGGELDVDDGAGDGDDPPSFAWRPSLPVGCVAGRRSAHLISAPDAVEVVDEDVAAEDGVREVVELAAGLGQAQGLGAADDLHDLGGDAGLAHLVGHRSTGS